MIKGIGFDFEMFKFPVGEMHVRIKKHEPFKKFSIEFVFEKNEDIIELLLVCDAMNRKGMVVENIIMPYVPFGRQDRVEVDGECFSLAVFAKLINSCNAESVMITDPHSDVTTALINNCAVKEQYQVFWQHFANAPLRDFYLICPDGGALKKIYKLAKLVECIDVIECSKKRDTRTGQITGVVIHANNLNGKDCYIVDDICDGGKTFIEISKSLKACGAGKIVLMVTHGFFTKGLEVFEGLIDEIYTYKGRVK